MDRKLLNGALNVSRETMDRLIAFETLFEQWSKRINLIADSTKGEIWQRHIEDSAQLLLIKPDMRHLVDIGSGGGFPGIVLAAMLEDVDGARVDLVESNRKKTAFLMAAKAQCARSVNIHSKRIEDALPAIQTPDYVTARALAALPKLFELTQCHLSNGAVGLFHKGRGYREELEESHANWDFDLVIHKSRIDTESVILEIANLKRK
ncbi:16S rRNA (guanine(527)-N(7))-methyltransferase RsmG [Ahrensia kielensis]|uniref:Ribosomal RNA small subunit methyltransferase G n=1 Tax=Ahrensia kielensis TaxID=76980 RepID=A0ABU9T7B7_9HYPH